jgi:hypothetical protein
MTHDCMQYQFSVANLFWLIFKHLPCGIIVSWPDYTLGMVMLLGY